MDNERTASIRIGVDEYVLLLTTKATRKSQDDMVVLKT